MRKTSLFVLVAVALILAASNARAATIVASSDFNDAAAGHGANFNVPAGDYANGGLIGQPASAPVASQWVNTSAAGTNAITVAGNTGAAGGNGSVTLTNNGEDDRLPFTAPVTSGSVYMSADINLSAAQTGDYFLHLGDGTTSIFDLRVYAKNVDATHYQLALLVNGSTAPVAGAYGAAIPYGTVEHIVAQYNFVSGSDNDTGALYLNPTDPILGGDNLYVNGVLGGTTTDATQLAAVYLRQGSASAAASETVDNIVVATVPEPATLALAGLGLAALIGGLARRKLA
jgi:hypothetical protein